MGIFIIRPEIVTLVKKNCKEFSGCSNYIGYQGYCYICRFCDHYSSFDVERIKYEPTKLIIFALGLFNDMRLCQEFDITIDFFWEKDYE